MILIQNLTKASISFSMYQCESDLSLKKEPALFRVEVMNTMFKIVKTKPITTQDWNRLPRMVLDRGAEMNPGEDITGLYRGKDEHSPYFSVNDLTQESVIGGV